MVAVVHRQTVSRDYGASGLSVPLVLWCPWMVVLGRPLGAGAGAKYLISLCCLCPWLSGVPGVIDYRSDEVLSNLVTDAVSSVAG